MGYHHSSELAKDVRMVLALRAVASFLDLLVGCALSSIENVVLLVRSERKRVVRLPTVQLIGVQKSGTSAVADCSTKREESVDRRYYLRAIRKECLLLYCFGTTRQVLVVL